MHNQNKSNEASNVEIIIDCYTRLPNPTINKVNRKPTLETIETIDLDLRRRLVNTCHNSRAQRKQAPLSKSSPD